MKIRSLTLFADPGNPIQKAVLSQAEVFANWVNKIIKPSEYELQTLRFATPPFPLILQNTTTNQLVSYANELVSPLTSYGFDYVSLGPALPSHPESYTFVPDLIKSTKNVFCSGLMTDKNNTINL
jgi:uncharacterized protein (UPF0210 family)